MQTCSRAGERGTHIGAAQRCPEVLLRMLRGGRGYERCESNASFASAQAMTSTGTQVRLAKSIFVPAILAGSPHTPLAGSWLHVLCVCAGADACARIF